MRWEKLMISEGVGLIMKKTQFTSKMEASNNDSDLRQNTWLLDNKKSMNTEVSSFQTNKPL